MLYLIWSLLNAGLFVWFLFLLIKSVNFIWEEFGLFASIVLSFGLLSTCNLNEFNKGICGTKKWSIDKAENEAPAKSINTIITKNMMFGIHLYISYGNNGCGKKVLPLQASSFLSGYHPGIEWAPTDIYVDTIGQKVEYRVFGTLQWKLLGATIISEGKDYKGFLDAK